MVKRFKSKEFSTLKIENKVIAGKNAERIIDKTPVIIEASSDGSFLKPIILVEDGVAKTTKYCLRRTKKGMLRLE